MVVRMLDRTEGRELRETGGEKVESAKKMLREVEYVIWDLDGTLIFFAEGEKKLHGLIWDRAIDLLTQLRNTNREESKKVLTAVKERGERVSQYMLREHGREFMEKVWSLDPEKLLNLPESTVSGLVMEAMAERGKKQILITYAPEIWRETVFETVGIDDGWFETGIITGEVFDQDDMPNKADVFRKLVGEIDPSKIVSIGNNEESELQPARELGMKAYGVVSMEDLLILFMALRELQDEEASKAA